MIVCDLSSWEGFEEKVKRLLADWQGKPGTSRLLFRGQSNSDWQLKTTLERYAPDSLKARNYYRVIYGAKYQIESLTDRSWNIPTPKEYNRWLSKQDFVRDFKMLKDAYAYMIHLRHHGFPSPFLDWSQSPYVAAYFAFNNSVISDKIRSMHISNASGKEHQAHLMHPAFMASGRQFEAMPVTFCSNLNIQSVSSAVTINGVTHAMRMYFVKAIVHKTFYGNLTFPQRKN